MIKLFTIDYVYEMNTYSKTWRNRYKGGVPAHAWIIRPCLFY